MSDSNVYTAEKILSKRTHNGVTQYYIKWKGYKKHESTWEPIENILDRSLLTAFEKEHAKKGKRASTCSSGRPKKVPKLAGSSDDRENSIDNQQPDSSSKVATPSATPPPASPRFEQPIATNNTSNNNISNTTASPNASHTPQRQSPSVISRSSNSAPTPPLSAKTPPITPTVTPKVSTPLPSNISTNVTQATPTLSQSPIIKPEIREIPCVQEVEASFDDSIGRPSSQLFNSNGSHMPVNNILPSTSPERISTTNGTSATKNKRVTSKFAILNTIITDVTVNDQTITISESKTNQGFFKEVSRHSVAVDTTNPSGSAIMPD